MNSSLFLTFAGAFFFFQVQDNVWDESNVRKLTDELQGKILRAEREAITILSLELSALEKRPEAVYHAIKYLQSIRSIKAVPVLCERLVHEPKCLQLMNSTDTPGELIRFPAAGALVGIGEASIDELLMRIGATDTAIPYRSVAFTVMEALVGKERVLETVDRFQNRVKESQKFLDDPRRKEFAAVDQKRLEAFKAEFKKRWKL